MRFTVEDYDPRVLVIMLKNLAEMLESGDYIYSSGGIAISKEPSRDGGAVCITSNLCVTPK